MEKIKQNYFCLKQKSSTLSIIVSLYVFSCTFITVSPNLFCNGDFESYNLFQSGTDSQGAINMWNSFSNDNACWYTNTFMHFDIEVKTLTTPFPISTKVADTAYWGPYNLCQKIYLLKNCTYVL